MRIAVISPHADDAALSLGGLMTRLTTAEVSIYTCFSRSCTIDLSDSPATTTLRSLEDDSYASNVHARLIRFGLPDTNVRTNVGLEPARPRGEGLVRAELRERLAEVLHPSGAIAVFVPMAIGEHPDHVHCREAAMAALAPDSLIFYEDLPYAQFEGGPVPVEAAARRRFPDRSPRTVALATREMERKLGGLDHYRSQIAPEWRKDVEAYGAALVPREGTFGERYWVRGVDVELASIIEEEPA